MTDLLIRRIEPQLKRQIEERARKNRRSLSAEVKALIQRGLMTPTPAMGLGTWMFSMVDERDRGDDLVFEVPGELGPPPDFE
jgi:hypothetical protein